MAIIVCQACKRRPDTPSVGEQCMRADGAMIAHDWATVCPLDLVPVEMGTCCTACHVMAGPPCEECGEPMYHRGDCPTGIEYTIIVPAGGFPS